MYLALIYVWQMNQLSFHQYNGIVNNIPMLQF